MKLKSLVLLLVFVGVFFIACGGEKTPVSAPEKIVDVSVANVEKTDLAISKEFVGQLKGAIDAEIRARVEGVIVSLHFEEGKPVKEGQLLYKIDPAPFLAKVAEAKAKVAQAETLLVKAQEDLQRIRPLAEIKALSQRDLDAAIAQEGATRGGLEAAQAGLEAVEIELSYCEIKSPTDGMIGLTKAKVGEFVGRSPNPVVLNVVSKLDPIHVLFSVTEKEYLYFARLRQKEIAEGKEIVKRSLELILADDSVWPERGEVASTSREIDVNTGSLSIEASFPNKGGLLRPGQYGKIKVIAETLGSVLVIPNKAVKQLQGINQVFVVGADNVVELKNIKIGASANQMTVVEEGLNEGDRIVVDGLQKIRAGTKVKF